MLRGRSGPETRPCRFLHVSTDEVYGALGATGKFHEGMAYAPNSPYSASKAGSDHLVRAYHHTYGLPVLTTNCSNNYGPRQHPEKLIPLAITRMVKGEPIPIYGDGQQVRDWLYVEDHCAAIETVIARGVPGETYCIGGDNEQKNLDLVDLLCDRVDEALGRPAGHQPEAQDLRPGPGRSRSPVRHRRHQDPEGPGLAPGDRLRGRTAPDGGVVPGPERPLRTAAVHPGDPQLSVLIVGGNARANLAAVLEALDEADGPDWEAIVAAGQGASEAKVRYLGEAEGLGFAEACNLALAHARGGWVLLLASDLVLGPGWVGCAVAYLGAHPRVGAVGGRVHAWDEAKPPGTPDGPCKSHVIVDAGEGSWRVAEQTSPVDRRVAMLPRGATLFRRAALEDVGPGFLEPSLAGEFPELDLGARLLRQGWGLVHLAELVAWAGCGRPAVEPEAVLLARSRWHFAARNFDEGSWKRLERLLVRSSFRLPPPEAEARRWCQANLPGLLEQRRRLGAGEVMPYNAAVEALQSDPELPGPVAFEGAPPLVSIVISSYNYGRFLAEAIESALGQTHPSLEVVVVDDGSRDDSVAVAGRYPVKLVVQPNQGVATARNRGAGEAHGNYLVFLDADDRLEPDYVERCLEVLLKSEEPIGYVYTWMRHFGADSRIYVSRPFSPAAMLAGSFVNVSALMRRQAFERAGGFDPAWRLGHEDYELWVRMLHCGIHGVLLPEPLLGYRRHEGGRNTLPRERLRELRWRLRLTYPKFYWRKLLKDPLRTLWYLVRFGGFPKRRQGMMRQECTR